jgi:hypothetical protein
VKQTSKTAPLRRPDDSADMKAAVDWCEKTGLGVLRPTFFQLKVGHLNFYPDRGTIWIDGKETLHGGLPTFQRLIHDIMDAAAQAAGPDHLYLDR